MRQSVGNV